MVVVLGSEDVRLVFCPRREQPVCGMGQDMGPKPMNSSTPAMTPPTPGSVPGSGPQGQDTTVSSNSTPFSPPGPAGDRKSTRLNSSHRL